VVGPCHVMSIGAGGGSHTAGTAIDANGTFIVRSPDTVRVAVPAFSALAGPGELVGVGDTMGDGELFDGGGEMLGPWPTPVALHAAASTARRAPTAWIFGGSFGPLPRISPSLPHPPRLTRTYASPMRATARDRLPGSVPATIAAVIAFSTCALYVAIIVSQGDVEVVGVVVISAFIAGLGGCALVGGMRTRPDRVIPLGVATGGLFGVAIASLFSIGLLLLVAGVFALVAWTRAGVGASRRDQLLGGIGGAAAALGFLVLALVV
jgi:hypothetical protein